jgi:hypothetical protein
VNDREHSPFCVHHTHLVNKLASKRIALQAASVYSGYLLLILNPHGACGNGTTDYLKVHELLEASLRVPEGQTFVN